MVNEDFYENINEILDFNSFVEIFADSEGINPFSGNTIFKDSVITGYGTIHGRKIYIFNQLFSIKGGTVGSVHAYKISKLYDLAIKTGHPIIGIYSSAGARIEDGVSSLDGFGSIFEKTVRSSGLIPQISVLMGPCAGGSVYAPAMTDFVFMIEDSYAFLTGPKVIAETTGEIVSSKELGSADLHSTKTGFCDIKYETKKECFENLRNFLNYIPSNNADENFIYEFNDFRINKVTKDPKEILPLNNSETYDIKEIIRLIADKNSFFELRPNYAKNVVVGFFRIGGILSGIVANQPKFKSGCLDVESSKKIRKFVDYCDSFNIPIILLVDTPGFLPGINQEKSNIISEGSSVLMSFSNASVPKISLILRKAYGGAFITLASKSLGFDFVYSWENSEIAVMGGKQAVEILYSKSNLSDIEKSKKIEEYNSTFINPYKSAKNCNIDSIINSADTREVLYDTLILLSTKNNVQIKKKHINYPL